MKTAPIRWLVPLTHDQIVTLRSALDSMAYERAPGNLRSSGGVLDAGDDDYVDEDPGAGLYRDLASEIDAIDCVLLTFENAGAPVP